MSTANPIKPVEPVSCMILVDGSKKLRDILSLQTLVAQTFLGAASKTIVEVRGVEGRTGYYVTITGVAFCKI